MTQIEQIFTDGLLIITGNIKSVKSDFEVLFSPTITGVATMTDTPNTSSIRITTHWIAALRSQ